MSISLSTEGHSTSVCVYSKTLRVSGQHRLDTASQISNMICDNWNCDSLFMQNYAKHIFTICKQAQRRQS